MSKPRILIASDHRGVALKARLITWANEHGYEVKDFGPNSTERCDAIDFACKLIAAMGPNDTGVLICGTGQAMAMTANRYRSMRAALCANATVARLTRQHNDANVLVLGADIIGEAVAVDCLETFLGTDFLGGRYGERLDKLTKLGGL